ncbi:MAG: Gfo/Idh/MocA family oxidoreductase [Alicyclobacillus herbarius]|nr:Gfo/Idh/MocA family oxidoreductase [Alicyclobacillus herbarius]
MVSIGREGGITLAQPVRIGIIGAGNIGKVHIREFLRLDSAVVLGVTDAVPELAKRTREEFSLPKVYENIDNMLLDDEIDAVVIGVPNRWHAPIAISALEAGKHVLLEKPMAIDSAAAKDIVRAQQRTGKVLMISHQMRWQWNALAIKEQVEKGELGRIYMAKTGWMRRKGIPGWGTWFTRKEDAGGGPLIDIGVHMLDLAMYLMGNPKPVAVYGSTYAEFGPRRRGIGNWGTPNWDGRFDVEDLASALIKMEDGSTLTLDVSWAVHADTDSQPFVHLMGSEGGASIVGQRAKFLTEKFNQPLQVELTPPQEDEGERARLSRHFVECVQTGREPISSAVTGLANNLILDAIYESSRSGREVLLDWSL